jgi:hypothetical protein
MYIERKMNLTQYLRYAYGVHNSNVDFIRHVQPLYAKLDVTPKKEILIQSLIGVAVGAYILYDTKLIGLTNETIEKFLPLI